MPIPWSVASILTPHCINLLLQRLLFLSDESLSCPFHHCLDLVKIQLEACVTSCMKLVTLVVARCVAVIIAASRFGPLTELIFGNHYDVPSL